MRPITRITLAAGMLCLGLAVAGCADFDPDKIGEKLDVFGLTKKKPLPGERKDVFPGGVPGVSQGVPPELMKGYQAPAEAAPDPAEAAAAKAAQAGDEVKPKPKPKKTAKATQKPSQPANQPQPQVETTQGSWPAPQQAAPQQAQGGWPSPPQQPTKPWPTSSQ
ncbi:MAG: hypothetical protein J2P54_15285 [Bradyrhizobiaceae bacterium]|nr:hypothetical protein [Bradyrhizobiaceae bacterium]